MGGLLWQVRVSAMNTSVRVSCIFCRVKGVPRTEKKEEAEMGNPLRSFLLLFLILLSSPVFFLISCESVPVDPRPRAFPSFKIQEIKVHMGSRLSSFALRKETYFCCSRSLLLFGYCIDPYRRRRSGGDVPTL